ncbi:MAG: hypothetical protein AB7T07_04645 [Steroidobacteraceae bacterium]
MQSDFADSHAHEVMRVGDVLSVRLIDMLARFGMQSIEVAADAQIPGSYWGESEAGLSGDVLYFRRDTPLHSVLHEACHYICMDATRRAALDRDAGGDHDEENAVCYLQILLADHVAGFGRERMLADMDAWGYTFRLGSARAWFEQEADDARQWLLREGLIAAVAQPVWQVRR